MRDFKTFDVLRASLFDKHFKQLFNFELSLIGPPEVSLFANLVVFLRELLLENLLSFRNTKVADR